MIVVERPNAAVGFTAQNHVADMKRSILDDEPGDHAAALVAKRLQADAHGRPVRIRLQFPQLGTEEDRLQQLINASACDPRGSYDFGVATPLDRHHVVGSQILQHALLIAAGKIKLVHGDDDRHFGRPRVADGFDRLRHDAVVGRHDQNHEIGQDRPAGPHLGEGRVTRRIDERDLLAIVFDLIGGNVLSDAARLSGRHVCRADLVQQRRFPVIDVSQNRDDGGAFDKFLGRIGDFHRLCQFLLNVFGPTDREFDSQFHRQIQGGLFGERRVDGRGLSAVHQHPQEIVRRSAQRLGQGADGDRRRKFGRRLERNGFGSTLTEADGPSLALGRFARILAGSLPVFPPVANSRCLAVPILVFSDKGGRAGRFQGSPFALALLPLFLLFDVLF